MKRNSMVCAGFALVTALMCAPVVVTAAVAPDFSLEDVSQGTLVTLDSYKGRQPVLVLFWTTWCPFCQRALKQMNQQYPVLQEKGIAVLAINVGETSAKAAQAVRQHGLQFPVLLDESENTVRAYELLGVPTYVLVDKEGNIVFKVNTFPEKKLADFLQQ